MGSLNLLRYVLRSAVGTPPNGAFPELWNIEPMTHAYNCVRGRGAWLAPSDHLSFSGGSSEAYQRYTSGRNVSRTPECPLIDVVLRPGHRGMTIS